MGHENINPFAISWIHKENEGKTCSTWYSGVCWWCLTFGEPVRSETISMSKCQTSIIVMQPPQLKYAACHTKDDRGKEGGSSPVPLLSVLWSGEGGGGSSRSLCSGEGGGCSSGSLFSGWKLIGNFVTLGLSAKMFLWTLSIKTFGGGSSLSCSSS